MMPPAGVGDPGLGAVDGPGSVGQDGPGAHRLEVGSAAGFGERHGGAQLAGGQSRQIGGLLLVRAELPDEVRDDGVAAHRSGQGHPAAGQLLRDEGEAAGGDVHAAVLGGGEQAEDAELLHLLDELFGIGVGVLQFLYGGLHLGVDEVGDDLDDRALLVAESRRQRDFGHRHVTSRP